jgi:hypothetical protein
MEKAGKIKWKDTVKANWTRASKRASKLSNIATNRLLPGDRSPV